MKIKLSLISAVAGCALFVSGPAMAQIDWLSGWSGTASLGAFFTSGNTDTTNVNGSASVSKQINLWRHTAFGSTYTAEFDDVDTADRFELGYQLDRNFTDTFYGFGRLRYDEDDFSNIDSRVSGTVGVGNVLLNDGKQNLRGEIGIGGHQTDFIVSPDDAIPVIGEIDPVTMLPITTVPAGNVDGLESDGALLFLGLKYSNLLSDRLVFNSVLDIEATEDNSLIVWDNSLNISLTERISLSLGLLTRTNTDIGDAFDETDTATRVNIVFGI